MAKTEKPETISAETFRQSTRLLGWSHADTARELGLHSRQRAADFARGRRKVPNYIARHLATKVDQALRKVGL